MYTTTSMSHLVNPQQSGLNAACDLFFFRSEWSLSYNSCTTANDNTAHDLHQPAVSGSSAHRRVHAGLFLGLLSLFFGASCRESRFSRRCFASRAENTKRIPEAALTAVKWGTGRENMGDLPSEEHSAWLVFFIQDVSQYIFFIYLLLHWSPSVFLLSSDYFNLCVNASKSVEPGCDYEGEKMKSLASSYISVCVFKECAGRRLTMVVVVGVPDSATSSALSNRPAEGLMLLFHVLACCQGKDEYGRREKQMRISQRKRESAIVENNQNVNCIAPGGASAGLFPDGGGGRSTGSGSFEGKGGRERWRQIEGLSLIRLPYRRVHSAGSAAVSKLKLTGSAGAACSNGPAGPSLTVIRRLDFMSLAPAKKSPDLLRGSAQVPSNKIHIKHLLMWFSSPRKRRRRISMGTFFGSPCRENAFVGGKKKKRKAARLQRW